MNQNLSNLLCFPELRVLCRNHKTMKSKIANALTILKAKNGSRFRQNFMKVTKANMVAQILPLITAPILTRLYSPADFGIAALFSSVLAIFLAVASMRLDWSIPNASSRIQAVGLVILGFFVATLFCIGLSILFWKYPEIISSWNGAEKLLPFLMLIPLALFGSVFQQLMQAWHVREGELKSVGKAKIVQSISATSTNLGLGWFAFGAQGLIISAVISSWVGVVTLLKHARGFITSLRGVRKIRLLVTIKRFWCESMVSVLVSLVNSASLTIVPLLFAQHYSSAELGQFMLMQRIVLSPTGMLTAALGQSFWAEAAQLIKKDPVKLKQIYISVTKKLMLLAFPIAVICICGPLYVGYIFVQEQWSES